MFDFANSLVVGGVRITVIKTEIVFGPPFKARAYKCMEKVEYFLKLWKYAVLHNKNILIQYIYACK